MFNIKKSFKTGLSFGLTSGVITTLGLMVGLHAGTKSQLAVIGGILVIAIADALSDALGIHVSEEAENENTNKEIWESTMAAFISKLIFALTFIIPVLLFELDTAILISIIWGLFLVGILSWQMARDQKVKTWKVVVEHLAILIVVVVVTHYVGDWVAQTFR